MNIDTERKVFVAAEPVDFRKQHHGLAALGFKHFDASLAEGHYFLFTNKRRNGLKILYYQHGGLVLVYKKLVKGSFPWPKQTKSGKVMNLSSQQFKELFTAIHHNH